MADEDCSKKEPSPSPSSIMMSTIKEEIIHSPPIYANDAIADSDSDSTIVDDEVPLVSAKPTTSTSSDSTTTTSWSNDKLSALRNNVEDKSHVLAGAWSDLYKILGEYKAELFSKEIMSRTYEGISDVQKLRSELLIKDNELYEKEANIQNLNLEVLQRQNQEERNQVDLSVKDSLLKKYQQDLLQKDSSVMTANTKILRLESRIGTLEAKIANMNTCGPPPRKMMRPQMSPVRVAPPIGRMMSPSQRMVSPNNSGRFNPGRGRGSPGQGRIAAGSVGRSPGSMGRMTPGGAGRMTPGSVGRMTPSSAGRLTPGSAGRMTPGSVGRMTPNSVGRVTPGSGGRMTAGNVRLTPGSSGRMMGTIGRATPGAAQVKRRLPMSPVTPPQVARLPILPARNAPAPTRTTTSINQPIVCIEVDDEDDTKVIPLTDPSMDALLLNQPPTGDVYMQAWPESDQNIPEAFTNQNIPFEGASTEEDNNFTVITPMDTSMDTLEMKPAMSSMDVKPTFHIKPDLESSFTSDNGDEETLEDAPWPLQVTTNEMSQIQPGQSNKFTGHQCAHCPQTFSRIRAYKNHMEKQHPGMKRKSTPELSTDQPIELDKDETQGSWHTPKDFSCLFCSKTFIKQKLVDEHVSSDHIADVSSMTIKSFKCEAK